VAPLLCKFWTTPASLKIPANRSIEEFSESNLY
jgi:hypothetical protein